MMFRRESAEHAMREGKNIRLMDKFLSFEWRKPKAVSFIFTLNISLLKNVPHLYTALW